MLFYISKLRFQPADAFPDQPPVHLQLLLSRAPGPDAAAQTGKGSSKPGETGRPVFQLGELHLDLSLTAHRVGCENIQDQQRPVDDLAGQFRFQIADLGSRQFIIADDPVRFRLPEKVL